MGRRGRAMGFAGVQPILRAVASGGLTEVARRPRGAGAHSAE
jgi:hypothetical protein